MSLNRAVSWLAFIALLGGVARALMAPAAAIWGTDSIQELVPGLIACVLMAIGVAGLYLGQLPRAGVWGFIGFICLSLGSILTACLVWTTMIHAPADGAVILPMINNAVNLAGFLLFGAITLRVGILPRWAAILLMIWPFVSFIPFLIEWATALWGISYIGLAYPLLRNER